MSLKVTFQDLMEEINLIRKRYPTFKDDAAFVFWFLVAYLVDNEQMAKPCLTGKSGGKSGEKGLDAIFIDYKNQQCNLIQGKFHTSGGAREPYNDVIAFAQLAELPWADKQTIESFCAGLDPLSQNRFTEMVNCVRKRKHILNLHYVTTGKCTPNIETNAKSICRNTQVPCNFYMHSRQKILQTFKDYIEDITPHIPPLRLLISSEGTVQKEGIIHRFDPQTDVESWVFSVSGRVIAEMFERVGDKLVAKNIRGWLGKDTDINQAISSTIRKEPANFWYYNNGITVVCNDAKRETSGGQDCLIVESAQVINGQQTTRALHANPSKNVDVLVKVIKVPRNPENDDDYDKLVNSIVHAANWQNYISPSDLVSNDSIQIHLEREFRKAGYQYMRKRMSKTEARRIYGQGFFQIKKTDLAQSVGACLFDPAIVRRGKEWLFENPYYKSIFSSKKFSYYLPKYWLTRQVQYSAHGHPNWVYAKWLVLNYSWRLFSNLIDHGQNERRFRITCEQKLYPLNYLWPAIVDIYRAALRFYKENRGIGETAKDTSTFFQATGLDKKFHLFWISRKNPFKVKVDSRIKKFKNALAEIEDINE